MRYEKLTVAENSRLGPGHYLLALVAEEQIPPLKAGQFLNLRCVPEDVNSLMRPFSILGVDSERNAILVYYKVLGRQSGQLVNVPVGSRLDCLYPLGKEFPWQPEWSDIALVGGGVGLAPLLYMAEQLQQRAPDARVTAYFGGNSESDLVPRLLDKYDLEVKAATMDGSCGFKGNVVELYRSVGARHDVVYTCGPNPMMQALKAVVDDSVAAYASLEEYMACGVGACLGCVAAIEEDGAMVNRPVCKDGPVFPLHAVHFH